MDHPHAFAETYYCSDSYAMGNVQMTIVDNPNQQMVWSIVAKGATAPLCFSGGQPMRGSTSGHSPYTQTVQSKETLLVLTAPTKVIEAADTAFAPNYSKVKRDNLWLLPDSEQGNNFERRNRQKYAAKDLLPIEKPKNQSGEELERFWKESKGSASTWFYYPRQLQPIEWNGKFFFEAEQLLLAIIPVGKDGYCLSPSENSLNSVGTEVQKFFHDYSLLVFPGRISGYVVETAEKKEYGTIQNFIEAIGRKSKLDLSRLEQNLQVNYHSLIGDDISMNYNAGGLRCKSIINGKMQNWDRLTEGSVYLSPYININKGMMKVSDGKSGYLVDFRGDLPLYKELYNIK
jgi:hypothetical protein